MSKKKEIKILQNSKSSIKDSIINKWVEISDNAKLDEYPDLIDDIPTGDNINDYFGEYTGQDFKSCMIKVPPIDTSTTKSFWNAFNGCNKLTDVSNLDTTAATNFMSMFYNCTKLVTIPKLKASNVTNINNMFVSCNNLTNFGGLENLGKAYSVTQSENSATYKLDLSYTTKITHDSLMNVINNLYDILTKGCNRQQLVLGSTNLAKLTADEIAIATNKGWNVT